MMDYCPALFAFLGVPFLLAVWANGIDPEGVLFVAVSLLGLVGIAKWRSR